MAKITFAIPVGSEPAKCRSCGDTIYWIVTAAGKPMPVNPDGQSHFSTCPQAPKWRRNR